MNREEQRPNEIETLDTKIALEIERQENDFETRPSEQLEFLFNEKSKLIIDEIREKLNGEMGILQSIPQHNNLSVSLKQCKQYGQYFIPYTDEQIKNTIAALEKFITDEVHRLRVRRPSSFFKTKIEIPHFLEQTVKQLENVKLAEITKKLMKAHDTNSSIWRNASHDDSPSSSISSTSPIISYFTFDPIYFSVGVLNSLIKEEKEIPILGPDKNSNTQDDTYAIFGSPESWLRQERDMQLPVSVQIISDAKFRIN